MSGPTADAAAERRYRALEALAEGPEAVAACLEALGDEAWRVRRLAVERLARARPDAALVHRLVLLLEQGEAGARNAAASVLGQWGPVALPQVSGLLAHPDAHQRKFAADILGALRLAGATPALVQALDDADANVRTAAAEALGQVGGAAARLVLDRLLLSADVMLRVCALEGLAHLDAPPPLPALTPHLMDPLTRRSAWRLLARIAHPTAWLLLVRGLAARESRDAALGALGGRPVPADVQEALRRVIPATDDALLWLTAALASDDDERRRGALRLAHALREARLALPVARAVRGEADGRLALEALLQLGPSGAQALLSSSTALVELPAEGRAVAFEAIVALAHPGLVAPLVAALEGGEPELAELAVRALGRTQARQAIAPLARGFDDDALAVHAGRSLTALAAVWPDEVRAALSPLTRQPLRPHLVRAWGAVAGADALEVLRRAAHDAQPLVRAAAVEAYSGPPDEGLALVQAALLDEAAAPRRAAARAVGLLAPAAVRALLPRLLADVDPTVVVTGCEVAAARGLVEVSERLKALARAPEVRVAVAALHALAGLGRLGDDVALRASLQADGDVLVAVFTVAADRPLLLDRALDALRHPRWDVRVAAARLLAVSGRDAARGPLEDAASREEDPVARALLEEALATLTRRTTPHGRLA